MSFNPNDTNTIHLGNYEEFFILYMDNELSEGQKKMVEDFLQANPDLQAELEMLMSTKLPAEEFSFDKAALLADNFKLATANEELLLYMDDELAGEKKRIVELELASNPSYQKHYAFLSQTKLDATEILAYPNKKELYRGTEKIIAFKLWMRIAAAVMVIAAMGVVYYVGNDTTTTLVRPSSTASIASQPSVTNEGAERNLQDNGAKSTGQVVTANKEVEHMAIAKENQASKKTSNINYAVQKTDPASMGNVTDAIAISSPSANATTALAVTSTIEPVTASFDPSKQIINTSGVTSALSQRNTTTNATTAMVPGNDVASSNENKGSFKSFLRKATRLIERKTGVDATNGDDEELLIGAVAVKLK